MYERFFGLVDAPFRLTPDPRYLFLSAKHADALAHLRLGISESSGFVCITGDVGAGKTTLLRRFLSELGPEVSTAYIFNPALSSLELLQTINAEFGLPSASTSKKSLVDALNTHLLMLRQAGRQAMVIIDEAQALELDVLEQLRLLSNLETTTEKLLRVILVGQPQLRSVLQHPGLVQLNQRITLRWHIGPLDRTETAAYVRHRLAVASRGQCGRIFTPAALRVVHRVAGGVPRLINMVAHRSMLAAFASERRLVTARSVLRAHREIESVPLPGRATRARRLSRWAPLAAAAGVAGIALGGSLYLAGDRLPALGRLGPLAWVGTPAEDVAGEPGADSAAVDAEGTAVAAADVPAPAPTTAMPRLASMVAAGALPPDDVLAPVVGPSDVEQRLAGMSREESARAAFDAMLAAWRATPLQPGEAEHAGDFMEAAHARSLEHLEITGNAAMLELLDVPAVLELRLLGVPDERYATLIGMSAAGFVLAVDDGPPITVSRELLAEAWFGQAHLVWQDFEQLGPRTLRANARGRTVRRLQSLLARAALYEGPETGVFDDATMAAVLELQRSRFITVDGQVGRLTRLVLYAAAGGYPRPTLAGSSEETSIGQAALPDGTRGAS